MFSCTRKRLFDTLFPQSFLLFSESAVVEEYLKKAQVLHCMSRKWHYIDYKDFAGPNYKDSRKNAAKGKTCVKYHSSSMYLTVDS